MKLNIIKFIKQKRAAKIDKILNGKLDTVQVKLEKVNQNALLKDLLEIKLMVAEKYFKSLKLKYDYIELLIVKSNKLKFNAYKKKTGNYSTLISTYIINLDTTQTANLDLQELEFEEEKNHN